HAGRACGGDSEAGRRTRLTVPSESVGVASRRQGLRKLLRSLPTVPSISAVLVANGEYGDCRRCRTLQDTRRTHQRALIEASEAVQPRSLSFRSSRGPPLSTTTILRTRANTILRASAFLPAD